jgi:hypothetical protein
LTYVDAAREQQVYYGRKTVGGCQVSDQDRLYHIERARRELDLAYQAERHAVAEAHMKLSALHMARLKKVDDRCSGS